MSTIRVDNFAPSAGGTAFGIEGIAKAWVSFDGTGTVSIGGSYNTSSITDFNTGYYSTGRANPFANTNYSATGMVSSNSSGGESLRTTTAGNTSTIDFVHQTSYLGSTFDPAFVSCQMMGDLA